MNKVQEIVDGLLNNDQNVQIATNGEIMTNVKPEKKYFTLEELYKFTNCDIVEFVYLPNKIMVCDEEGILRKNPKINLLATLIVSHQRQNLMPIYGDVLIVNQNQIE